MVIGIGIDIVAVAEVESSIETYGNRYLERIFTAREVEYCSDAANAAQRYAARVAAKEAAMKAFGTGWESGVDWLNFEVVNDQSGRPSLVFTGAAAELATKLGVNATWVSLAHLPTYAVAEVVLERI